MDINLVNSLPTGHTRWGEGVCGGGRVCVGGRGAGGLLTEVQFIINGSKNKKMVEMVGVGGGGAFTKMAD